ncbi:MAG: UDP-N-acetylmuramate--L-alanine ligase [Salibacteraceae bacterium]
MKVHFIAIGGSAMHNLALALHHKGYEVSGSDDEIFEPSRSRLAQYGILPEEMGWFPERVYQGLDAVILGMHARANNPELLKAREIGVPIYSYPEYVYEQSKDKTRVVIGGSHGKTTITAMLLHVLQAQGMEFDYLVGAQLDGFETMVKLTKSAPIIVLEGDEYLSSPIDRRPKFHWYRPQIALLSGIAWDHINVFPTFENYVEQFRIFIDSIEENGTLAYYSGDEHLRQLVGQGPALNYQSYTTPDHVIVDGKTVLKTASGDVPLEIFGAHNLQNLEGAQRIAAALGIAKSVFYQSIATFSGAARRLQKVAEAASSVVYKDFAHSPSKLKATTAAVKAQYARRRLVACMELHTFSSLNADFLKEYAGAMNAADRAIVYFNPHTIAHKKLPPIAIEQVREAFQRDDLEVLTDSDKVRAMLRSETWEHQNLLLMTSGNFDGMNLDDFGKELLSA